MSETQELYNKYRPERFTDFIGQPFAIGVGESIARGDHAQTFLISGPKGVGKTSLANVIAASMNCESIDRTTGDPCCTCESCVRIAEGSSFDVIAVNAAEDNSVNSANALIATVREGIPAGKRVYIIDEAHRLTPQAQSSFLGVMEKPPVNVVFIMTTTNPKKILDTITSRASSRGELRPIKDDVLKTHLSGIVRDEKAADSSWGKVTDQTLDEIISVSEGSVREALSRLANFVYRGVSSSVSKISVTAIADAVLSRNPGVVVTLVEGELSDGAEPAGIAEAVAHELVVRAAGDSDLYHRAAGVLAITKDLRDAAFPGKYLTVALAAASLETIDEKISRLEALLFRAETARSAPDEQKRVPSAPLFSIEDGADYRARVKSFIMYVQSNSGDAVPSVFLDRLKAKEVVFKETSDGFEVTFDGADKGAVRVLSELVDPRITVKG